jgi:hypothetical protein
VLISIIESKSLSRRPKSMKRIDPMQEKALKWYMDFLSDDLATLPYLDFSGRVLEARHYFTNSALLLPLDDPLWKEIDPIEYSLHAEFRSIESPEDFDWEDTLTKIQAALRRLLKEWYTEGMPIWMGNVRVVTGVAKGSFYTKYYLPVAYKDIFTPRKMKQLARISFANAVHGIPLEAIKTCKDKKCGRHFLHLSEKPKYYCSPKCTSRDLSRIRREADPEAYREKQREIMRKKSKKKKQKGGKK